VAPIYDFSIDQGATKRLRLLYRYQSGVGPAPGLVPIYTSHDLAGCSARMQIRQAVNTPVLVELTSGLAGGIVIEAGGADGQIDIGITDEQTEVLELRRAVYDLELEWPSGDVTRLMQGKITISLNVTETP
jgi:hypothetical protein